MNKIIYGGILTILILAILSIFAVYSGLIPGVEIPNNKKEYWTFELYPGNNQINITQEQIDCG